MNWPSRKPPNRKKEPKVDPKEWQRFANVGKYYRRSLSRTRNKGRGWCVFIMLNPSTADGLIDDPTILRCMWFAQREGKRKLFVLNLFTGKATKPKDLWLMDDPVGPNAKQVLRKFFNKINVANDIVICAWGVRPQNKDNAKLWDNQVEYVHSIAAENGIRLYALHMTKDGYPGHPLYVRSDVDLLRYEP